MDHKLSENGIPDMDVESKNSGTSIDVPVVTEVPLHLSTESSSKANIII
jgi:hypothetical protein